MLMAVYLTVQLLKSPRQPALIFLSLFIFAKSLSMLDFIIGSSPSVWIVQNMPALNIIFLPFLFIYAPAFYLYIRQCVMPKSAFSQWHVLHGAPFILFVIFLLIIQAGQTSQQLTAAILNHQLFSKTAIFVFFELRNWLVIAYLFAAYRLIRRYQQQLHAYHSNQTAKQINWLLYLTAGLGIISIWGQLYVYLGQMIGATGLYWQINQLIYTLLLFIFANLIILKSLSHRVQILTPILTSKSAVKPTLSRQQFEHLHTYMRTQKPYLDPSLNLDQLAQQTRFNPKQISNLLKTYGQENFYHFVNRFRIEAAKNLLNKTPSLSITNIIYECGFNSKSTFNHSFKSMVGQTPSQYRQLKKLANFAK